MPNMTSYQSVMLSGLYDVFYYLALKTNQQQYENNLQEEAKK